MSCRIAWKCSKGGFPSGTSALGELLSLGGLPEKEMAAHLQRRLQHCWLSLGTLAAQGSFNEAFWIRSLAAAAGYQIICVLMS